MVVALAPHGQWGERGAAPGTRRRRGFARTAFAGVAWSRCYPAAMVKLIVRWLLLAAALTLPLLLLFLFADGLRKLFELGPPLDRAASH